MKTIVVALLLTAFATQSRGAAASAPPQSTTLAAVGKPIATESNSPGDIPDTQTYVAYVSAQGGYRIQSPEGWARSERGRDVRFVDKFDGMSISIAMAPKGSSASRIRQSAVAAIEQGARAGRDFRVSSIVLSGGAATSVDYTSDSDADPVTAKRVRQENQAVVFIRGTTTATLVMWAPLGADNADQWGRIRSSFHWR